jgi:FAD/FMN-containing dehydrogenase
MTAELIQTLRDTLGQAHVLTGADMAAYCGDWTGKYTAQPIAVARPANTDQVAATLRAAAVAGIAVIPSGGRTGLVGGSMTKGGLMLSLDRMTRIRDIRPDARIAIVEAGVILSTLHDAAEAADLLFPLWFGARGSATIGGVLSTNAGGSNVLRYGSTRALCLGLEVVLADGRVLDLMGELHKDNSGYDLRDLFIGAEGTLGVITAAVMKLVPRPRAYATATLGLGSLGDALTLLNRLQAASGGLVEAFEFMPDTYMRRMVEERPDVGEPFVTRYPVTILVELGATAPHLSDALPDGSLPLVTLLETTLVMMMEAGLIHDALVAQTETQRRGMWQRRELAAEVTFARKPAIDTDVALPLDQVESFLTRIHARLPALDGGAETLSVAHLGDGNVHFTVFPTRDDPSLQDAILSAIEDEVQSLRGSFSAEHGVGLSKLPSMARRKDPVALDVMRAVKRALDPAGRMNPGKVIPD